MYEGNETAVVSISSVSGADAAESGTQSVTITITENESAPRVTLSSSANSIAENAGSSLTLTATLSIATTADVTVGISTVEQEPKEPIIVQFQILLFQQVQHRNSIFTPTDDSTYEGNETRIVAISRFWWISYMKSGTHKMLQLQLQKMKVHQL